jgi:hypothetical protein
VNGETGEPGSPGAREPVGEPGNRGAGKPGYDEIHPVPRFPGSPVVFHPHAFCFFALLNRLLSGIFFHRVTKTTAATTATLL